MHKPRRRTNYYERFYFEYDGMLYKSKKNCCEQLGLEYGSVLGYRRVNNCSFTEAIDHFKGLQEEQQFIFRNRKWLSLQTCCDYYGLNKYSVLHYKYDYGFTIQESLEKAIKHAEQLKFKYKGKTYPSFPQCCKQMGIPTNTVRKCMKETGRSKAVALTYCIKKAEERKYGNPSPFIYRNKEYPMFTKCCCEYNIEPEKVRQKSKALGVPLQRALDYFLLEHPVRRKKEFDKNLSESTSELCRTYGIKRSDIYNYLRRNNSSKEEAIKHYIELNATVGSEPIVFQGVEYVDLRECCRMLDISYRWVCEKILNQELSVEEVLLYYKGKKEALRKMEKEPIRLENGVLYNNLAEFCTALKIRKKDIYGYIYANDCSVSEAATYYADRQVVSEKEIPQIGDRIYTDLRECCKDQKVPYRWVCNKMLQEDVSVQDAVQYYKRKQEKRQQKAQRQVPVKGKMPEPQPVNVLGKKYESKERCYKGLGITKKSVQNHMKKTSCTFEEAVVYCYEKKLEKQFEFRGEIYKSYNACCTAYNLAQEYVAIKAKREKITRQEAMEKLLAQREPEKTI